MSYEYFCIFKTETDSAVLVIDPDSGEELWIPLSQIESMHKSFKNPSGEGTIIMSDWIARKKGLL